MTGKRNNAAANWARSVKRLRRLVVELRRFGYEVIEPADIEVVTDQRIALSSRKR